MTWEHIKDPSLIFSLTRTQGLKMNIPPSKENLLIQNSSRDNVFSCPLLLVLPSHPLRDLKQKINTVIETSNKLSMSMQNTRLKNPVSHQPYPEPGT